MYRKTSSFRGGISGVREERGESTASIEEYSTCGIGPSEGKEIVSRMWGIGPSIPGLSEDDTIDEKGEEWWT